MNAFVRIQIRFRDVSLRDDGDLIAGGISDDLLGERIDGYRDDSYKSSKYGEDISVRYQHRAVRLDREDLPSTKGPDEFRCSDCTSRCLVKSLEMR
jgi:hypothetical protein